MRSGSTRGTSSLSRSVRWRRSVGLSALLLSLSAGCDTGAGESPKETLPDPAPADPNPGAPHPTPADIHEFISAEGTAGQQARSAADAGASGPASSSSDQGAERTVEEGDIYRVLGAGKLLNLNPYRGLQIIDITDVTQPRIIGKLKEAGQPVEMYVIGQRAVVLLNNWTGYYGGRASISTERKSGGLVLSVDLSDPSAPKVTDREFVPGSITTSRVTREGDRAALYVASENYECSDTTSSTSCASTIVQSFDVSTPDLVIRSKLDLGGYVSAVQATPTALIVGRTIYDANGGSSTSHVSLIDISHIDGNMVEGAQVAVRGQVQNKFNLDLSGNVLRVVSGATWQVGARTNHLETFDTSDKSKLTPIAHCTFGEGENLYATLFMPDRAFFVTFLRVDPFHAFALDAQGHCQERTEFVVSGWNDFFKPVFENRRLVGIGRDDQSASANVAVSLYDTTDLDNPSPLVARERVEAQNSQSTASWDDKAFTVLENAVSIPARADASVIETGLALIPFTSYGSNAGNGARAGVQLFTFSERTLTRRGEMNHGQPVQRSFRTDTAVTANLGAEDLSLFDTSNPDAPVERGRVELAPSYSDVHDFGTFLVRVHDLSGAFGSWWNRNDTSVPSSYAEIVAKGSDPDGSALLAKFAIPAGSRTFRVGNLLVVAATIVSQTAVSGPNGVPAAQSILTVYDLQNPSQPVQRSSLQTDRLLPAYGYGWGGYYGGGGFRGMGCGMIYGNYYDDFSRVLPGAVVFGRNLPHQESIGQYENCYASYSTWSNGCGSGNADCSWDDGYENCSRKVGADVKTCTSDFVHCEKASGKLSCTPIARPSTGLQQHCSTYEQYRYWQSMELDVLDLSNPDAPTLSPVNFASDEEAVGLVASAQSVYFSFKKPFTMSGDARPFSKYYFREVGLSDPAHPLVGAAVNVPGQLLAAHGTQLFTRDLRWGSSVAETWLHAVRRVGDLAEIVASQPFSGREVTSVLVDNGSRVYASHRALSNRYYYDSTAKPALDKLDVYGAENLGKLGETEVDTWSSMTQVVDGRVLFSVPGGMMIVNAQTPGAPYAQAYFPRQGYFTNNLSFDGTNLYVASGPYGIHQMDATTHNLLPAP